MKLKLLTIAVALAATSASSFAADKEGFFVGAFGDYYDASWLNTKDAPNTDIDDSTGWGAEVGYRFSDYWSARLEYADMEFDATTLSTGIDYDKNAERYGIDAMYHFSGGPFYGVLGLKEIRVFEKNTFANLGLGYQHFITDGLAFNVEAAYYRGLDFGESDFNTKIGLSYLFNQGSDDVETVEPAPQPVTTEVDSDNDGVVDSMDQCPNTPMTDAVDSKGCTLYKDETVTTSLLVTFPHDSAVVKQQYFDDIADLSKFLKEYTTTSVLLEGHASAPGDASYNMALSKKRAEDVAKELVKDGIAEDRINTIGYGEERLKNPANTAAANAENRRVEAQVSSTKRVKVKR